MRQSGRTTQMLLAAEEAQQWGHVLIVVPTQGIEQQCRSLAGKHGINLSSATFATVQQVTNGKHRGFSGQIFEDHTTWEMPSSITQEALLQEIKMMRSSWPTLHSTDPDEQERQELREQLRRQQAS